jgi:RimJ/RimL family protein N-acetyltransferase
MIFTDRLRIIPLEEKHLASLTELRNDPSTWKWLTDINPVNSTSQKDWLERLHRDSSRLYLAIEVIGTVYQFVGIIRSDNWDRVNRSVRIGIDLLQAYRGKGYATEAFSAFIDYLFNQQNMHRIWLLVAKENKDAIKLYEKLGFSLEGSQRQAIFRDGAYHDYLMLSILENEWKQ